MTDRETVVRVESCGSEPARVHLRTGVLAPRLVARTADAVEVALVATTATLLGGDHARVRLEVGAGCRLVVRDVAATVAYDGRGGTALWDNVIDVEKGGVLVWQAEPFVVSDGADVRRSTRAEVAEGGRLLLRDTVGIGRSGQAGGALRCRTRMTYDGTPAVAEDLDLSPESRSLPGMLAEARIIDTITALGWRPTPAADHFELAAPGTMARRLTREAHTSDVDAIWSLWSSHLER
ncbi:urease accessory protein UreD [Allobranchiibius sp. GilTou73]|uniref:urease accessory protein UreD n=1 Tax=Allobranchiibius sp. GilTou73 TaxID=2904523 RepID=UPI001F33764E|nr:urease accessory protein UreD [Allobranchiibius sp. GilTou73]UIJ36061.1 urease accessory protein UreD [Allobranchiibius sp. GilTou73]